MIIFMERAPVWLSPSVADYRATSPDDGGGKNKKST
jgi:hypothetical protein